MSLEQRVSELAAAITPVDGDAGRAASSRWDQLAKPPGSLGAVEDVGARLAALAGRCPPPFPVHPAVLVAAADHGVAARGVTRWPSDVTAAMVRSFCAGTAAVSVIAATVGARVSVLDVGVAGELPDHPRLRRARVRAGTSDLSQGAAMTREEAARALLAGAGLAEELVGSGVDLLVPGDMGIGNTTAAACLVATFTGRAARDVVGRGASSDDATVARKTDVVAEALALHDLDEDDPLGVLAAVGGLEHAALAGIILSGAADRVPVVLDGVSVVAAALVATALAPPAGGYLLAGSRSPEPAASLALATLGLEPILDLGLRLGEGTGGLLAVPIVVAAARLLGEMGGLDAVAPAAVT